jgi:hypothetical protein
MNSKLLKSKYGKGSDFHFFDFRKSERREDTIVPFLHNNNKTQPIKEYLDNTRILIVEDNKINMLLAKKLVKKIMPNCIIFEATDGKKSYQVV